MGNEPSKHTELPKNGKLPRKHENGSVSGLSVDLTSNGVETDVKSDSPVQQNGKHLSLNFATQSAEHGFVVVESDCQHPVAPVVSEILEPATIQKEEVNKSKEEKVQLLGKMFKKKAEPPAEVKSVQQKETLNEDQTDVSPPVTDTQPESSSSGDEAAATIIAEHGVGNEDLHRKVEISTQTDEKTEADISTQTGDDDITTFTEGPAESVVTVEAEATGEDSVNDSAVDIAEEVVEDSANEKASYVSQQVVILENNAYENMVFRAERVEVVDSFDINHVEIYNPEEDCVRWCEETEQECNPEESIIEGAITPEETNSEPLEVSFTLPKASADCLENAVGEYTEFAAANTPEPSEDEVITEDNGEGAEGMTADVVLIETTEPESIAAPPEAEEANGVPPPDEELITTVMETISDLVCEEPNPTPANEDIPVGELSVSLVTEIVVQMGSAHEEATADGVALEDVPGLSEQENFGPSEPIEKWDSCAAGEMFIVESPSNYLTTIEEVPEDILIFLDDEFTPECTSEVIIIDENAEVGEDVIADVGPDTVEEAQQHFVFDEEDFEMIAEAAIEALSHELELSAVIPLEPAMDVSIFLEEQVIHATTFVPLCEESSTEGVPTAEEPEISEDASAQDESAETAKQILVMSDEPVEENQSPCKVNATTQVLESIVESVIEAISERHGVTEDIAEEPACEQANVSVQQDSIEEDGGPAEELLEDADKKAAASSVVTVEEPTNSKPVIAEEDESLSLLELQPRTEQLATTEDEVTDEILHETDSSGGVSAATDENSEDPLIANSTEPVAECVKAVLETILGEIIAEEVLAAECTLVTSEAVAPETITEEESNEKSENDSNVSSTDSTLNSQSAEMTGNNPMTGTDMDALLVARLQSACTSVVEESAFRLPDMDAYSEASNLQQESESLTEPESVTLVPGPEEENAPETDNEKSRPAENQEEGAPEENPVMNFFKTLVTPTKTTKKETAAPDASKDQSQKETPPEAPTTVAQVSEPPAAPKGMSIPPPPPPEPPKIEIKGEPAAKPVKPAPKEEPKAAAKEPESSKGKSARDTLSKFFRGTKVRLGLKASKGKGASASGANAPAKTAAVTIKEAPQPAVEVEVQPVVEVQETPAEVPEPVVEVQSETNVDPPETAEEVAQPVVEEQMVKEVPQSVVEAEKVDPSKASTLEAAAKPEPPPPVQEEKKTASKSSFLSLFKPKVLLDHMTTKVQAASTSGVRLLKRTSGVTADPKKAAPAPAEAVKAKEEPKGAPKSSEAVVDSKPAAVASQAGDDGASAPKKLEKRNSIQLFFKIRSQKRNSTDAGVQTEPAAVAPAAEKAK